MLKDEDQGRQLALGQRRRHRGHAREVRDDGVAARVHDGSRRQLEDALPGRDAHRFDAAGAGLEAHEEGVEVHVQRRGRGGELVGQAGEREGRVGQDVGPPSARRRTAAGHGQEPAGDGVGEALVERLWRSGGRGPVETANRAHHPGRRHATEKAVALDERRARARARGRHGGGQSRGAATDHHNVVAQSDFRHPIPSRMTSTMRATLSSVTAPSIQDTTRLFLIPQRLKNTPIPGRGSTEGAW